MVSPQFASQAHKTLLLYEIFIRLTRYERYCILMTPYKYWLARSIASLFKLWWLLIDGSSVLLGDMGTGNRSLYRPKCGLSSGHASRAFGSLGLGVSTFPWGCVTDTRENESPLIILRPKGRGRISYPLGVWNT
ncbi:hypothetical protein CRG98_038696 [Punica granatum]|uniref:Uncharacterized protein n=1 Tax=Punica granatum TaxID=22663 RepID=A0A2I0IA69_PUNGR|nr:hypothetical protein CRG98_038696 [Punica granatum]